MILGALAGAVIVSHATRPCAAEDLPETRPSAEMWSGAQATANSWYAYSGLIYAVDGDVFADGWRLKATTGGGNYSYDGRLPLQSPDSPGVRFQGTVVTGEVSGGYQQRLGPMIARAFLGASYVDHQISPDDVFNQVSGTAVGAVASADLWLDIDARAWVSAGGSYDTAFSTYAAYLSAGYRVLPELSLGVEAGAFGNGTVDAGKVGALLRWDTGYGEMTAAAGLSGDYADPSTPYGRIDWLVRF
jgi:hypothetical protein